MPKLKQIEHDIQRGSSRPPGVGSASATTVAPTGRSTGRRSSVRPTAQARATHYAGFGIFLIGTGHYLGWTDGSTSRAAWLLRMFLRTC